MLKRTLPSRANSPMPGPAPVPAPENLNAPSTPEPPAVLQTIQEDVARAAAMLNVPAAPAPASAPVSAPASEPASAPVAAAPAERAAAPAQPAPRPTEPSKPDQAHLLRRRDKRPRTLELTPAPAAAPAPAAMPVLAAVSEPAADAAAALPTPLPAVLAAAALPAAPAQTLQAAGVLPPETDPLTSAVPARPAETFAPLPEAAAGPLPDVPLAMPVLAEIPPLVFAGPAESGSPEPVLALPEVAPLAAPMTAAQPAPQPVAQPVLQPALAPAPEQAPAPPLEPALSSQVPWATGVVNEPVATAPGLPAAHQAAAAPAPAGWDVASPGPAPTPEALVPGAQAAGPVDIFKHVAAAPTSFGGLPVAGALGGGAGAPPPELPGQRPRGGAPMGPASSMVPMLAGAAVVVAALGGAWWWVGQSGGTAQLQQQMAAITQQAEQAPAPSPDFNLNEQGALLPPPDLNTMGQGTPLPNPTTPTALIQFADVPPAEAGQPIVADPNTPLPEDVGFIASLQNAIQAERTRGGSPTVPGTPAPESPAEVREQSANQLQASLADELAAYRRALAAADSVAAAPKPSEFFNNPKAYMGQAPGETAGVETADTSGNVVAAEGTASGALLPPPAVAPGAPNPDMFTNNPNNLPILPEPTAATAQKIRTLEDFDVSAFEPEQARVRIPQGLRPRLSRGEFPALDVLSFVPGKGVIGLYDGTEGVLLIGENLEGWQLVRVDADNAEFRKGNKTNYVSAE